MVQNCMLTEPSTFVGFTEHHACIVADGANEGMRQHGSAQLRATSVHVAQREGFGLKRRVQRSGDFGKNAKGACWPFRACQVANIGAREP